MNHYDDDDYDEFEPRHCNICDAVGHGYPGGGPCPLEVNDRYRDEVDADLREHGEAGL